VGSLVVLGTHDADTFDEEDEAAEADLTAVTRTATTPVKTSHQV